MTESYEEHRRSQRIARTFLIKYHWMEAGRTRWGLSQIKDLSATGLRFVAERDFPVGEVIDIEVRVPTAQDPLTLQGKIVWAKPRKLFSTVEYGLEFVGLDEAATRAVAQAVDYFTGRSPRDGD